MTGRRRCAIQASKSWSKHLGATGDGGYLIFPLPMMPPGGRARAKKANSGVAEKALVTNARSAPFFSVIWRECAGSVPETNEDGCNGVPHRHPIRVSNFVQSGAINRRKLEMFDKGVS